MSLSVGIDIGSTTVKVVVMDEEEILFKAYERHFSRVRQKAAEMLSAAADIIGANEFTVAISGSAGLGVAKAAGLTFIQEVFATGEAIRSSKENIDIVIELGGEDAKILFLTGGLEERMNGTCAGGTGAFIDQMASLLNVTTDELDKLSLEAKRIYPIASRCGVFAKSDIQPLLNQGASKADLAASIFGAVVDQTITELAQGRRIQGKIAFLGGPLFFFKGLQKAFVQKLKLSPENAIFPELGQFSVAIGSALYAVKNSELTTFHDLLHRIEDTAKKIHNSHYLPPLFNNTDEYLDFLARHANAAIADCSPIAYEGNAFLGIDCGSTTTKLVLINENNEILYKYYSSNLGNPVDIIREQLKAIRSLCGERINIAASVVTGYGEELIKSAFNLDGGIVETMAHFKAAKNFCPNVDFILDIGGQDIKCFKVKNNSVDSIMLNEACSSGCGSFIETFARSMGYSVEDFAKRGILSQYPVDLGSRCTVFMNSSVKQAQKEGATVADISAGLSVSVVKNALYKVIRVRNAQELGENIVVQGGTFYNDAVLRSFEMELGKNVIRPNIAGLMGAYGAALHAKSLGISHSSLMSAEELNIFTHDSKAVQCGLCNNRCSLTVNTFTGGKKYISGNRCEKPLGIKNTKELPNLFQYKLNRINKLKEVHNHGRRGTIGIPLALSMYENLPFWHAFFTSLGIDVIVSDISSTKLYSQGRYTIPSDTLCFPAKLMHGHIENLMDKKVDAIFYPCLTYNFNEKKGDNCYNCPVVAYYSELMQANITRLHETKFLYPYFGLHRPKDFVKKAYAYFKEYYKDLKMEEIKTASEKAYSAYYQWQEELHCEGEKAIAMAREEGLKMVVLAGRPYHIDPEINHGIDKLISSLGIVVLTEDSVADLVTPQKVNVLNQWTYHARLYNAAKYCTENLDTELIQLVSFGCGIDAITTDEVRDILEKSGKLYTQLKIDEINNLGAVKIRIRSLLGAIDERKLSLKGVKA